MAKREKEEEKFLVGEMEKIKQTYKEMKTPLLTSTFVVKNQIENYHDKLKKITSSTSHFCSFCYMDFHESNSTSPFYSFEFYRHLSGKKHENEVKKYLTKSLSSLPSLRSRFKPKFFKFTKNSFFIVLFFN